MKIIKGSDKPTSKSVNLSGKNLYGFLQAHKVKVEGIDPNLLRNVPFNLRALGSMVNGNGISAICFPSQISHVQIREIFTEPELPDLKLEGRRLSVELRAIKTLDCAVLGKREVIDKLFVTSRVSGILKRPPLVLVGGDANLDVFEKSERLNQLAANEPLVLGTRFQLENISDASQKVAKDPANILFLLRDHKSAISSIEEVLAMAAEMYREDQMGRPLQILADLPGVLTEKELLYFLRVLEENECFEAIAEVDAHSGHFSKNVGLYFAQFYQKMGDYEAGAAVFDRVGTKDKDNRLKLLNREFKRIKDEEEGKRKKMVIDKFKQLSAGKISAAQFSDSMPVNYAEILIDFILRNVKPEYYITVREYADEDVFFENLLNKIIEHVYERVREGLIINLSDEDGVLDLILKEDQFLPPVEWMPDYAKKAYFRKNTYIPAKKLFDGLYLNPYKQAVGAFKRQDYIAASKYFRRAFSVYPTDKNIIRDRAAFLMFWAQNLCGGGKTKSAVLMLEAALKIDADNMNVIGMLAHFYSERGEFEKALDMAARFMAKNPDNTKNLNLLGFAYYQKFRALGDEDAARSAIKYLERSYELDPESPQALLSLALTYAGLGEIEKACEFLKKRLSKESNIIVVMAFLEAVLLSKQKGKISDEYLASVLAGFKVEVGPENDGTSSLNILIALFESGFAKTARALSDLLEGTPLESIAIYARGINCFRAGDNNGTLYHLRRIIDGADDILIYNDYLGENISLKIDASNLYLAVMDKVDPEKAKVLGEKMIAEIPSEILYNTMGNMYEDNNPQKALEMYQKAAAINPYFVLPTINQLSIYRKQGLMGDYSTAVAALKKVILEAIEKRKTDQFKYRAIYRGILIEFDATGLPELREIMDRLHKKFPDDFQAATEEYMDDKK